MHALRKTAAFRGLLRKACHQGGDSKQPWGGCPNPDWSLELNEAGGPCGRKVVLKTPLLPSFLPGCKFDAVLPSPRPSTEFPDSQLCPLTMRPRQEADFNLKTVGCKALAIS